MVSSRVEATLRRAPETSFNSRTEAMDRLRVSSSLGGRCMRLRRRCASRPARVAKNATSSSWRNPVSSRFVFEETKFAHSKSLDAARCTDDCTTSTRSKLGSLRTSAISSANNSPNRFIATNAASVFGMLTLSRRVRGLVNMRAL